jgi:hypothetical protein
MGTGVNGECVDILSISPSVRLPVRHWCPRKESNLQPLVCRTSAPSVELLGRSGTHASGVQHAGSMRTELNGGRSWNRTNLSDFSDPR